MSKGTIHSISKITELEISARAQRQYVSDEQPTVADLALPVTSYRFSDKFARVLRVLGGETDFA